MPQSPSAPLHGLPLANLPPKRLVTAYIRSACRRTALGVPASMCSSALAAATPFSRQDNCWGGTCLCESRARSF